MSKLVLRNVSRTFGSYTAVDDLNLTLNDGELVSLLGGFDLLAQFVKRRRHVRLPVGAATTAAEPCSSPLSCR